LNISAPVIAAGLMGGILLVLNQLFSDASNSLFILIGQVIVGAVIYLGSVFLISPSLPKRTIQYLLSNSDRDKVEKKATNGSVFV
jgi:hypothetical protein